MPRQRQKTAAELLGVIPPKSGRDRLLAVAIDLFYDHGFQAIGIDRVITEAGVTKTTFYKHFESKDDLMVAAVLQRDEWENRAWDRYVTEHAGDDPVKRLLAMFDLLDDLFNAPDFKGCMFINTAAEFPDRNDPVHQAAILHKKKARDTSRDLAKQAGIADPEAFADMYTLMLEGALILRQTHGRNDAARVARPAVELLIQSHLPKKKPQKVSV
jgi:AcrR family transcriptional regulator